MATYSREQTIRGNTQTQTQTNIPKVAVAELPSVSLGEIIVQSFSNTMDRIKDEGLGIFNQDEKPLSVKVDEKEKEKNKQNVAKKEKSELDRLLEQRDKKQNNTKGLLNRNNTQNKVSAAAMGAAGGVIGGAAGRIIGKQLGSSMNSLLQVQNKSKSEESSEKLEGKKTTEKRHQTNVKNVEKTHAITNYIKKDVAEIKKFTIINLLGSLLKNALMLQGILGIMHAMPKILEGILYVVDMLPVWWAKAGAWFHSTFLGGNSIFVKAGIWIKEQLNEIGQKLMNSDDAVLSSIGKAFTGSTEDSLKYNLKKYQEDKKTKKGQNDVQQLMDVLSEYGLYDESTGIADLTALKEDDTTLSKLLAEKEVSKKKYRMFNTNKNRGEYIQDFLNTYTNGGEDAYYALSQSWATGDSMKSLTDYIMSSQGISDESNENQLKEAFAYKLQQDRDEMMASEKYNQGSTLNWKQYIKDKYGWTDSSGPGQAYGELAELGFWEKNAVNKVSARSLGAVMAQMKLSDDWQNAEDNATIAAKRMKNIAAVSGLGANWWTSGLFNDYREYGGYDVDKAREEAELAGLASDTEYWLRWVSTHDNKMTQLQMGSLPEAQSGIEQYELLTGKQFDIIPKNSLETGIDRLEEAYQNMTNAVQTINMKVVGTDIRRILSIVSP